MTYVIDYFVFENRNLSALTEMTSKLDRNYQEFVLDLPTIGCPKAKILGNLNFSLYLPEVLKLTIKKLTNVSKSDEHLEIIYDKPNQLLRVDDLNENVIEIADLEQKNYFHFKNIEQCTAFYAQDNLTDTIKLARSLIDEIYALKDKKFYHIGQTVLNCTTILQVFELSEIENEDMNVTTLFMRDVSLIKLCLCNFLLKFRSLSFKDEPNIEW